MRRVTLSSRRREMRLLLLWLLWSATVVMRHGLWELVLLLLRGRPAVAPSGIDVGGVMLVRGSNNAGWAHGGGAARPGATSSLGWRHVNVNAMMTTGLRRASLGGQ